MNPLSLLGGLAGGGMSASSSATSGNASGGYQDTSMGDFNFKSASGASSAGGGLSTPVLVAGLFMLGVLGWAVMRRK